MTYESELEELRLQSGADAVLIAAALETTMPPVQEISETLTDLVYEKADELTGSINELRGTLHEDLAGDITGKLDSLMWSVRNLEELEEERNRTLGFLTNAATRAADALERLSRKEV